MSFFFVSAKLPFKQTFSSSIDTAYFSKDKEVISLNLRTKIIYDLFITNAKAGRDLRIYSIKVPTNSAEWITLSKYLLDFESNTKFVPTITW